MQHLILQIHESLHGTAKLYLPCLHTPLLRNFVAPAGISDEGSVDGNIGASLHSYNKKIITQLETPIEYEPGYQILKFFPDSFIDK